jgi:hypothetical protein
VASRRPETIVKRAREQALREKRERKQAKKDAKLEERRAAADPGPAAEAAGDDVVEPEPDSGPTAD